MKQKIVVSNIRIPEEDWVLAKTAAAAKSMSVNAYIHELINAASTRDMVGTIKQKRRKRQSRKDFFQAILDISKLPQHPMGASEEDKIIYGIDDD